MSKRMRFFTNLIYFLVVVMFVLLRVFSNLGFFSFMGEAGGYVMSVVTQVGLMFLVPLLLFKFLNKTSFKDTFNIYGFKKISWKMVLLSVALGATVFCLNVYVSSFFNSIIQFLGYKPNTHSSAISPAWWVLLLDLICTALLPAFCEESLHRGMLLKGNSVAGMKKSIIISGVLFGLLHLNIEQFFYATVIGLFLGYLCWCCNSIYPCMIVHFMNNAISVFLSFASDKGWKVGNVFNAISSFLEKSQVAGFFLFMLVFIILIVVAFELFRALIKESFNFNFKKKQRELASLAVRENFFRQIEQIKNNEYVESDEPQQNVIYIDLREFLESINKSMIKEEKPESDVKMLEIKTKILMYGSIVLSAVVTIMTFIWGLFR